MQTMSYQVEETNSTCSLLVSGVNQVGESFDILYTKAKGCRVESKLLNIFECMITEI